jgi:hypothetical protein
MRNHTAPDSDPKDLLFDCLHSLRNKIAELRDAIDELREEIQWGQPQLRQLPAFAFCPRSNPRRAVRRIRCGVRRGRCRRHGGCAASPWRSRKTTGTSRIAVVKVAARRLVPTGRLRKIR